MNATAPKPTTHDGRLAEAVEALVTGASAPMVDISRTTSHANGHRHTARSLARLIDRYDLHHDDGSSERRWAIEQYGEIVTISPTDGTIEGVYDSPLHAVRDLLRYATCEWEGCEADATVVCYAGSMFDVWPGCSDHYDQTADGDEGKWFTSIRVSFDGVITYERERWVKWEGEASA